MFTNQNNHKKENYFMNIALNEAMKHLGNTKTNPSVGCVITKNNNIINISKTSLNGRPHAEFNALSNSKIDLRNSNLYVTLEPCSHYGITPPCVKLIIKRKIKRVFFSVNDPDIRSYNKSENLLKKKGIIVKKGILKNKVVNFYKSYFKYKNESLPFLTCKLAVSKDFYTINKKGRWITNKYSRGRVHLIRSNHDCIITSSNTVNTDNPRLTCRINGMKTMSPSRIILDNKLKVNINSKIIKEAKFYKTFIFYNKENKRKIQLLKKMNVRLHKISLDRSNNLNLELVLLKAKKLGFSRILLESGVKLSVNFLRHKLVDELKLFISNKNLNFNGAKSIKSYLSGLLKNKKGTNEKVNLFGEKLISYELN